MSGRHLRWGLAVAGLYVAAGLLPASRGVPVLPVFDGLAPPEPYRWVIPPPDAVDPLGEALAGEDTISIEDNFGAFTVITADGQAQTTILADAIELPAGQEAVHLSVTPEDPEGMGSPPDGLRFDSNAYRIEATYVPSGEPVVITNEATILLRYAIHAEQVLRWGGGAWEPLETTLLQGTLQVFANAPQLGVFVAAGPDTGQGGVGWPVWVGIGAGAAAALVGLEVVLRRRRSDARRRRTGRTAARKRPKPKPPKPRKRGTPRKR